MPSHTDPCFPLEPLQISHPLMIQKERSGELSTLLFYLQNNNLPYLVKLMFNQPLSEKYLRQYGHLPDPPLSRLESARVEDFVRNFDREIVHLKGSHRDNVKKHVNTFIQQCFKLLIRQKGLLAETERRCMWLQLTQLHQLPYLYAGLDDIELPPGLRNDIKKDVDRTYLSGQARAGLFQSQLDEKQEDIREQLTNVLQKFAKYNPYIGYCQGMNNLVMFMLEEGLTEEESFFLLKKVTEELLPCDYHSTMNSVTALLLLLCEVLAQTHPLSVKQIKLIVFNNGGEGISYVISFVLQWFVCLFTNTNLHRNVRRCIFDHFLLQGLPAFIKAALCFFDVIEPAIRSATLLQEFNPIVERVISSFSDLEHLKTRFNDTHINKPLFDIILNKMVIPSEKRRKRDFKRECDRRWTVCLETIEENYVNGQSHEFFVFKTAEKPSFIINYLDATTRNRTYFKIGKSQTRTDNLVIGRMQHCCRPLSGTSQTEDLESNHKYQEGSPERLEESRAKSSQISKMYEIQQPEKRELVRNRALQQLYSSSNERQSMLVRSESIQFMRHMIQNESFSNLMEILEVQQMNDLFRDCISEADEDEESNP